MKITIRVRLDQLTELKFSGRYNTPTLSIVGTEVATLHNQKPNTLVFSVFGVEQAEKAEEMKELIGRNVDITFYPSCAIKKDRIYTALKFIDWEEVIG